MTTMAAPEQLLLEMINRARLDPAGEAARLGIDLNEGLAAGTISLDPKQPLAGNNLLAQAAEGHSNVMLSSKVLEDAPGPTWRNPHTQAGDGTPGQRIAAQGYSQNPLPFWQDENIAAQATSETLTDSVIESLTELVHDSLFIDKDVGGRGHRTAMMQDSMREVGMGEITGPFRDWKTGITFNGVFVTQNFGVTGNQSFLTGAVYNDTKFDAATKGTKDFYDMGEGVQGVVATVAGVGSDTTGSGGGWSVGGPGGNLVVTFSGGGLANAVSATVETGNRNAKVDLVNGNEIFSSVNTSLGLNAKELHLLGITNINGNGNGDDNLLFGNKGSNVLDGAAGVDTAVFAGNMANYTITQGNGFVTVSGFGVTDTLKSIEKIQFADQTINAPGQTVPVPGSVAINNVSITEGNSGAKVATFTVTRSGGTAAFNVNFATSNGSATTADSDYVGKSGLLQFGANELSKTISVTLNGDTKVEANETFNVLLSSATNGATISDGQGVGTITNDDAAAPVAGSVKINDVVITEGDAGKIVSFTITRSGGSSAFNVNFAASDGTAKVADGDYVAKSGTLQFAANEMSKVVSFAVNGDTKVEANETFRVSLSGATNGATIGDNLGVATLSNDDRAHEDFGGNGRSDVLWRHDNGSVAMWQMNGTQIASNTTFGSAGTNWHIVGTEDFGGDGRSDVLWRSDTGSVAMWQMNGTQILSNAVGRHHQQCLGHGRPGRLQWRWSQRRPVGEWQRSGRDVADERFADRIEQDVRHGRQQRGRRRHR